MDLPEPDGPAMTVSWWRGIWTSTRSTATTGPLALSKRRVTPSAHATEPPRAGRLRSASASRVSGGQAVARITSIGRARTTPMTPITVSRPRASAAARASGSRDAVSTTTRAGGSSWRRVSRRGTATSADAEAERGAERDAAEQRERELGEDGEGLVHDAVAHAPRQDERRLPRAPPRVEDQQLRDQDDDRDQQPERREGAVGPADGQEARDLEDVRPLPGAAHDDAGRRQLRGRVGRRLADPDLLGRRRTVASARAFRSTTTSVAPLRKPGKNAACSTGLDEQPAALHAAQLLVVERAADDDRRHGAADPVPRDRVEGRRRGSGRSCRCATRRRGRRSLGRRRGGRRRSCPSAVRRARRSWTGRPGRRAAAAVRRWTRPGRRRGRSRPCRPACARRWTSARWRRRTSRTRARWPRRASRSRPARAPPGARRAAGTVAGAGRRSGPAGGRRPAARRAAAGARRRRGAGRPGPAGRRLGARCRRVGRRRRGRGGGRTPP